MESGTFSHETVAQTAQSGFGQVVEVEMVQHFAYEARFSVRY